MRTRLGMLWNETNRRKMLAARLQSRRSMPSATQQSVVPSDRINARAGR